MKKQKQDILMRRRINEEYQTRRLRIYSGGLESDILIRSEPPAVARDVCAVLKLDIKAPVIIASCSQYGALPHPGLAGRVTHDDMITWREVRQVRRSFVKLLLNLCVVVLSLRRGVGRAGGSA